MRTHTTLFLVLLAASVVSCSGGGSEEPAILAGPPGGSTNIAASFTPDVPNPGSQTVSMAQAAGGTAGNEITLQVRVTGTNDLYGADITLTYDSSRVQFVRVLPGSLLESGGNSVIYDHSTPRSGELVIGASRVGPVPGLDVAGSMPLVNVVFRLTQTGTSPVVFVSGLSTLQNDGGSGQPGPISGILWRGGTLSGV